MYDVIIIGSGPAGLSAAIYGKRACLDTLVVEKQPMSGGQILNTYEVDNYPGLPGLGGFELGMKLRAHADSMEARFLQADVAKVEQIAGGYRIFTNKENYDTRTVVYATGAGHRKLGVPGEDRLSGMGVSYCATCDGAFFREKVTTVVGGGDVALEDALFLARSCKKVYLVHRRDAFRGAKVLQEKVLRTENIEVLWDSQVKEILGEDQVKQIQIYNKKEGSSRMVDTDGIFIAVGIQPNSALAQGVADLDEWGYIIAGEDGRTSVPGVYAAGDVRTKQLRQVITAAADGANVITSVENYLNTL
ncbi:MAG: thioredoxin-disulfide reductase [Lachnospiraceae bacterium]|nr:thioredoxin-disulfide reductase [Lachnospiraceae bacterium]